MPTGDAQVAAAKLMRVCDVWGQAHRWVKKYGGFHSYGFATSYSWWLCACGEAQEDYLDE